MNLLSDSLRFRVETAGSGCSAGYTNEHTFLSIHSTILSNVTCDRRPDRRRKHAPRVPGDSRGQIQDSSAYRQGCVLQSVSGVHPRVPAPRHQKNSFNRETAHAAEGNRFSASSGGEGQHRPDQGNQVLGLEPANNSYHKLPRLG